PQGGAAPGDDRVRYRIGAQNVEWLRGCDTEAAALARREMPESRVPAERATVLVDNLAGLVLGAVATEELAVGAAAEEARLLTVGAMGDRQAGSRRLGSCLLLGLLAEREPDPVEQAGVEAPEHVGLVLVGVGRTGEEPAAAVPDDARVVPRRESRRACALGERKQLGEAEAPVAADARVRALPLRVAAHEPRHDGAPELLTEGERHM